MSDLENRWICVSLSLHLSTHNYIGLVVSGVHLFCNRSSMYMPKVSTFMKQRSKEAHNHYAMPSLHHK